MRFERAVTTFIVVQFVFDLVLLLRVMQLIASTTQILPDTGPLR